VGCRRQAAASGVGRCYIGEEGLEVVLDERVEGCGGGVAAAVDGGEAVRSRRCRERGGTFDTSGRNLQRAKELRIAVHARLDAAGQRGLADTASAAAAELERAQRDDAAVRRRAAAARLLIESHAQRMGVTPS
jgi:hypothetical protein